MSSTAKEVVKEEYVHPPHRFLRAGVVITIILALSTGMLYASAEGSWPNGLEGSENERSATIIMITMLWAFALNWLVSIPAIIYQTEKYFDFTGSITYITCTLLSFFLGNHYHDGMSVNSIVQSSFVVVWAVRLGHFLYSRIKRDSKDQRFDLIKPNGPRFFAVWTIQGLWVILTALPVFVVNAYGGGGKDLGPLNYIGWAVWAIGFAIEAISDKQKQNFAANPDNKGKYIEEGLWYYSRHPNYFGEMTLWFGNFLAACSIFENSQWFMVICPIFVVCLLQFLSGVPGLESGGEKKWGHLEAYQLYKANTSCVIIWFKGTKTELSGGNSEKLLEARDSASKV